MAGVATSACYAGCGTVWAGCYATAGLVAGTIVASPAAPAAALLCNAAEGICMTGCTSVALADPTGISALIVIPIAVTALAAMWKKHQGPRASL